MYGSLVLSCVLTLGAQPGPIPQPLPLDTPSAQQAAPSIVPQATTTSSSCTDSCSYGKSMSDYLYLRGSCRGGGLGHGAGLGGRDGLPLGWRAHSTCNMDEDHYFQSECHGYYYFRPYNYGPIATQQEYAVRWGLDRRNPYANVFFQKIYEDIENADPAATHKRSSADREPVPVEEVPSLAPQPADDDDDDAFKDTYYAPHPQKSVAKNNEPRRLHHKAASGAVMTSMARDAKLR